MAIEHGVHAHPALGLIGNTPMVEVPIFNDTFPHAKVLAKMEAFNPGGSVKDRPVARMLTDALAEGELRPGMTILDSSSGNAGIAYAMVGRILGLAVEIVIPANASTERRARIAAHGAQMVVTDALAGYDEAMREAGRRAGADPERYYFADQYSNDSNWLAHYHSTAGEILAQAPANFTHFIAGVGTGGTITGVGRRLREEKPNVEIVSAVPPEFPGVEGLKPLGAENIQPHILDRSVVDRWVQIDVEEARTHSMELAKVGLFVGQSAGAYMCAIKRVLEESPRAIVVTVLADVGERYFSAGLWDE